MDIQFGEILAWRVWRVDVRGALWSFNHECLWPTGIMSGDDPFDGGSVGLWAMKSVADLDGFGCCWMPMALGAVSIWGHVAEHTAGYRAQFARVASIDQIRPADSGLLDMVRRRYGVDGSSK